MKGNFEQCLEIILQHEGGFSDDKRDPGGVTNLGVTKKVYESWVRHPVSVDDMKKLTEADVKPIYEKNYWDAVKGDELPKGVDLIVFDFGVNSGPARSVKYLQQLVGTATDGYIGPNTLRKVNDYVKANGSAKTIKAYQEARQKFYEGLSHFARYGRGWTRRVTETTASAIKMAGN